MRSAPQKLVIGKFILSSFSNCSGEVIEWRRSWLVDRDHCIDAPVFQTHTCSSRNSPEGTIACLVDVKHFGVTRHRYHLHYHWSTGGLEHSFGDRTADCGLRVWVLLELRSLPVEWSGVLFKARSRFPGPLSSAIANMRGCRGLHTATSARNDFLQSMECTPPPPTPETAPTHPPPMFLDQTSAPGREIWCSTVVTSRCHQSIFLHY